jgi:hypothetical protein
VISLFILRFGKAINEFKTKECSRREVHIGAGSALDLVLICQLELMELQPKQWTQWKINCWQTLGALDMTGCCFWLLRVTPELNFYSTDGLCVLAEYSQAPAYRPVITGNSFGVNDDLFPQCRYRMPVKSRTHTGLVELCHARVMQNLVQIVSTLGCRHVLGPGDLQCTKCAPVCSF